MHTVTYEYIYFAKIVSQYKHKALNETTHIQSTITYETKRVIQRNQWALFKKTQQFNNTFRRIFLQVQVSNKQTNIYCTSSDLSRKQKTRIHVGSLAMDIYVLYNITVLDNSYFISH